MVGVGGRDVELGDEAVDLVEDDDDREALAHGRAQEALGLERDALDRVDDDGRAVREAQCRSHLARKAHVPRRVDARQRVVCTSPCTCPGACRQRDRHGRGLHAHAERLLVRARVRVALGHRARAQHARSGHERVRQARLAVVQRAHERDVPHARGARAHVREVRRAVHGRVRLLGGAGGGCGAHHARRHDRLAQRLRVLVLHERLHARAVHVLRARIVLLVLVQHNRTLSCWCCFIVIYHPVLITVDVVLVLSDCIVVVTFATKGVFMGLRCGRSLCLVLFRLCGTNVVSKLVVQCILFVCHPVYAIGRSGEGKREEGKREKGKRRQ